MKLREAKKLIIEAASKELGFKLVDNTKIEQHLVCGVKLGQMTAEQAAKITNENYARMCTRAFEKAES